MLTYRTRDGLIVKGETPANVLADLRAHSWRPAGNPVAYKGKTARAAELQTGTTFRTATAAELLDDLEDAGLLARLT